MASKNKTLSPFSSLLLSSRYRHEFKSNELWTEIKLVLDTFALPLTELFKVCNDCLYVHLQRKQVVA